MFNRKLENVIAELGNAVDASPGRSLTLRLGELKQAKKEAELVSELITALGDKSWHTAALYEQANIAHETQQLAGRIEVEGAKRPACTGELVFVYFP